VDRGDSCGPKIAHAPSALAGLSELESVAGRVRWQQQGLMMTARVLTGSKQEIAQKLANLEGEVREAIVFVEEPADLRFVGGEPRHAEDFFAEMDPYLVHVADVDDSREALYTRQEGE